ncbi:SDR family oxidoreductase [Streptomyces sp. NPDC087422]|uniref:SDR family oxidoreductase n=1 Tax=Streptomyces sp. NPDC087422 TaxID=3365786 RepID=UPI0038040244
MVTGGTGTLGRALVDRLLAAGRPVRVLSRGPRGADDARPYEWAVGDLRTGVGIDGALFDGVGTIAHCATTNGRGDVEATERLTGAAVRAGGDPHLVYISIVGVDRVPLGYYRAKLAAETVVEECGLPWTVLRTTQFHDLVARLTVAQRRLPAILTLSGVSFQPVDVTEVADRLADLAGGEPVGHAPDLGGPQIRSAADLTRATLRAAGRRRLVVPLRLPGALAGALRAGGNLTPDHADGRITYDSWLAARTPPRKPGLTAPGA